MRPRTLAIVFFGLLGISLALRYAVYRNGWLPVSQEAVLKRATLVRVQYVVGTQMKMVILTRDDELPELLAEMHLKEQGPRGTVFFGRPAGKLNGPTVEFVTPRYLGEGEVSQCFQSESPSSLGGWPLDPIFFEKLNQILSRREGRPINIFIPN